MSTVLTMLNIDMQHLFIMFLIFSFVGWTCEEIYCSIGQRKLVKRGMLYGPICPIYGFGGVIIIYCLYPWRDTWVRLFFASMILTSVLEYFVSWLLEKIFMQNGGITHKTLSISMAESVYSTQFCSVFLVSSSGIFLNHSYTKLFIGKFFSRGLNISMSDSHLFFQQTFFSRLISSSISTRQWKNSNCSASN